VAYYVAGARFIVSAAVCTSRWRRMDKGDAAAKAAEKAQKDYDEALRTELRIAIDAVRLLEDSSALRNAVDGNDSHSPFESWWPGR